MKLTINANKQSSKINSYKSRKDQNFTACMVVNGYKDDLDTIKFHLGLNCDIVETLWNGTNDFNFMDEEYMCSEEDALLLELAKNSPSDNKLNFLDLSNEYGNVRWRHSASEVVKAIRKGTFNYKTFEIDTLGHQLMKLFR